MGPRRLLLALSSAALLVLAPSTASAHHPTPSPEPQLLTTGLSGAWGSTVGPDGALYVAESVSGEVSRIDPRTGATTTFASGLPTAPNGGPHDIAFVRGTAYVLVGFITPEAGGAPGNVDGIYRMDGPSTFTLVADIGTFAKENPPTTDYFIATGVPYALQPYAGGFLVTDGHHNRVYQVALDGSVSVRIAFDNIVPTGIDAVGSRVYMAQAGALPHLAADGKIVTFGKRSTTATEVAAGGPLMVDVTVDRGRQLYGLAQGIWPLGGPEGSPASPDTGQLLKVGRHGSLQVVADGLDQPVSFQIIRGTAYVVTLGGEVWTVDLSSRHGHH
ncbi:ScyD/ScyE family protein [Cellulomonas humilata]|uniref:ScyD/ScyE family protein n=1 Tax=Cellulomonas humilata TaxID=144055 RepID=A0A7Y5ZYR5_9CELL|nr:ScyD/ScyE family protein [Cellulomonas humilata]NUU16616.1 ScyD/ScyE family protein [Cellulomonas humilata]